MFFIREGFFNTNSFHSSGSIFPSPFKSASLNVCGKTQKNEPNKHEQGSLTRTRMFDTKKKKKVPCPQLFQHSHRAAVDPIHAEVPLPSPSTVE